MKTCQSCNQSFTGRYNRQFCSSCQVARRKAQSKAYNQNWRVPAEFKATPTQSAMSWAEIGKAIGVSKQRAQQIFADAMRKIQRHPLVKQAREEFN